MGVQSGESLEAFLGFAVVDEPSGENVSTRSNPRLHGKISYLGDSGNSMINNASTTAGMTCIPKANLHCIELSSAKFAFVPNVVHDATSAPIPSINCCNAVTLPLIEGCAISA